MTEHEFCQRVKACERRLYKTSYLLLFNDADCADAVQEALLKAWRNLNTLREERYFETWLMRICINECKQMLRARSKRPDKSALCADIAAADGEEEDGIVLRAALAKLPERYRLPIVLKYIEGYAIGEIAAMLHLPQGTISWRLSRAVKQLRSILEQEEYTI